MTRIRTHKKNEYFIISNATAQDDSLSLGALGLLTYALSMPESWDFYPKVIWKKRNISRDAIYGLFNELIQSYHAIRIRHPNPKAPNLPGEVEYEIFDDIEDCKNRIKELENTKVFLEHGGNFNKCFRRPEIRYTEAGDPVGQYNTNETGIHTKETSSTKEPANAGGDDGFSSKEPDKPKAAMQPSNPKELQFDEEQAKALDPYTSEQIAEAKRITLEKCNQKANSSRVKFFFKVLASLPAKKPSPSSNADYARAEIKKWDIPKNVVVEFYNEYVEFSFKGHSVAKTLIFKENGFADQLENILRKCNANKRI